MDYFNFYFIKKLFFKLFSKKTLIYIIIFLIIIILKSNVFAVTIDTTFDVEEEIRKNQEQTQNSFVLHCMFPFSANTSYWQNDLKPIFDDIKSNDYDFYIGVNKDNTNGVRYSIRTFYYNEGALVSNYTYTPDLTGVSGQVTVRGVTFNNNGRYLVTFYPSTNTGTSSYSQGTALTLAVAQARVKTDLYIQFVNTVYNGGDYSGLLNSINNYLSSISSVDTDILSSLNSLSQSLITIQNNTSTNYSQQISQISNKISDILSDNDTIISQNSQMIQEQQEINDNLEQLSDDIQDVKDTLTDDTVESSASDLPSTNVQNPTENGIDNIFQSIYDAFCNGQAQDIVFPIPFTNKNITLSPYYVRDALNNNNAGWVYTLIQAFWGYLIGRFIVSDISKKIDKIKSGNIENVENSNIKEEML